MQHLRAGTWKIFYLAPVLILLLQSDNWASSYFEIMSKICTSSLLSFVSDEFLCQNKVFILGHYMLNVVTFRPSVGTINYLAHYMKNLTPLSGMVHKAMYPLAPPSYATDSHCTLCSICGREQAWHKFVSTSHQTYTILFRVVYDLDLSFRSSWP